ncbi:MAG: PDZ domain-containing protein [Bacteroidetes bacterium]|nr:PDZ domain-containing protein [Bacteroidota bacterium]
MKKSILSFLLSMTATLSFGKTETEIKYRLSFEEPNSHLMVVSVSVSGHGKSELDFVLPSWRPGRYAIQNYSRLVQEVSAFDDQNKPIPAKKINKDTWRISISKNQPVTFSYKFYANILDAGSTLYNEEEIYFNGSNLFVYVDGFKHSPVSLTIDSPKDWKTATALKRNPDGSFVSANYDDFIDCPTIISPTIQHHVVTVRNIPFHIWIQGKTNGNILALGESISKIAESQLEFWDGIVPFSEFHFLYHFVDYRNGHGVEHATSTSMVLGPLTDMPDSNNFKSALGTTSHELFHAWNVKKLIPADLVPYDFTKEQYSDLFWFVEGFTSYFDLYLNYKAGILTEAELFADFANQFRIQELTPGNKITSLSESSFDSWLYGYASDGNRNKPISFYGKGEIVGFLMDLKIRSATNGKKQLRDVMLQLYRETVPSGKGYTKADLLRILKSVSGEDFQPFFTEYIDGVTPLPYEKLLAGFGLSLEKEPAPATFRTAAGLDLSRQNKQWVVTNVRPGSPALKAGLDIGDVIKGTETEPIPDTEIDPWLEKVKTNDSVTLEFTRSGETRIAKLENLDPVHYSYKISWKESGKSF